VPRLSFALENLKNIQEMIRFADAKAGAILVVYGFIISLYVEIGKSISFCIKNISIFSSITFVCGFAAGSVILHQVISIILNIVRPRMATDYNSEDRCLYYFDHIARCTKVDIVDSIQNIDEKSMVNDIASQIHENAKILNRKLIAVKSATDRLVVCGLLVVVYGIAAKLLEVVP
jgi:hypothetical protein